jgi:hypothetical protein
MSTTSATTAAGFGDRLAWSRMRPLDFWPMRKGKLLGFELPTGLRISDIPIVGGRNGAFAGLPARPVLDQEGLQKRNINGKPRYTPFLEWRDRSLYSWFSDTLVALIFDAHPDALKELVVGSGER